MLGLRGGRKLKQINLKKSLLKWVILNFLLEVTLLQHIPNKSAVRLQGIYILLGVYLMLRRKHYNVVYHTCAKLQRKKWTSKYDSAAFRSDRNYRTSERKLGFHFKEWCYEINWVVCNHKNPVLWKYNFYAFKQKYCKVLSVSWCVFPCFACLYQSKNILCCALSWYMN